MKKIIISLAIVFAVLLSTTGCIKSNKSTVKPNSENSRTSSENNSTDIKEKTGKTMYVNIDGTDYAVNLEDNGTAEKLVARLPLECELKELNGNEKYVYLDFSLPTEPVKPKHINAGDVMLYGDSCLVIFYKSFDTQYSYTKIGHIDSLPNLGSSYVNAVFYIL